MKIKPEDRIKFSPAVSQVLMSKLGQIDAFKGSWKELEDFKPEKLSVMREMATIQSVGSSNRIEGTRVTDKEVKEILQALKTTKFFSREEQEVTGYYEALQLILDQYIEMDFNESTIKTLHHLLLKYSKKDQRHKGKYKTKPNAVALTKDGVTGKIIFNTTPPLLTYDEMESVIRWTNENLRLKKIHPLIVIAHFVYEFLSIHPFEDGNGRLSRLLTTLLLLRAGYGFVQYISFEHEIENRKNEYYSTLIDAQRFRATKKENISSWTVFFLDSLENIIRKLQSKYEKFREVSVYLLDRQKKIRLFIEQNEPVRFSDIENKFRKIPAPTLKKDLQYLVKNHLVDRTGSYKASQYIGSRK
jgi:Fic family protein